MRALELFSCSGGMAEGFARAGITFDVVVDKDPDAVQSYETNRGHRPLQMSAQDFLRLIRAGWRPSARLDLIVADPPCTPWSRAGKRLGVDDERDMLGVSVDIILMLRPRAYLIGNVPGLEDSPQWPHLQAALAPLHRAGYCVADFATLDAADYGVPQHRIRPFWFGHIEGRCIRWPAPTHCDPAAARQARLDGVVMRPWVTCRDALAGLDDVGRPVRLRRARANGQRRASDLDAPARVVCTTSLGDGNVLSVHDSRGGPSSMDKPSHVVTTNSHSVASIVVVNDRHPPSPTITAKDRGQSTVLTWPWDRPSTTVTVDDRIPPSGNHASRSILSMPGAVLLSERAAARLQGFPDEWVFSGRTKRARWSQIGQAMPPALAEAVARSVVDQMRRTDDEMRADTAATR